MTASKSNPMPFPDTVPTARSYRRRAGQAEGQLSTVIASLVAARVEDDGSIDLTIVDPDHASRTLRVVFPVPGARDGAADPALGARMQSAHAAFIRELRRPTYEAPLLLYGAARLTLARGAALGMPLCVLDFALLDAAPPPTRCACRRQGRRGFAAILAEMEGTQHQEGATLVG